VSAWMLCTDGAADAAPDVINCVSPIMRLKIST
jgi:hypothetical protein